MDPQCDSLTIEKINARLNPEEKALRLALMNRIISSGMPADMKDPVGLPELSTKDLANVCSSLVDKKVLVLNQQQQVQFAYPVSALPTPHRVQLADGRSFHAMCAIDAMGTSYTFEQNVAITSRCSQCSEPIELKIHNGQIEALQPAETHVLHVDLNNFGDWSGSC